MNIVSSCSILNWITQKVSPSDCAVLPDPSEISSHCVRLIAVVLFSTVQDEESMELVLRAAESLTQFGEDCEVVDREREAC